MKATSPHHQLLVDRVLEGGRQQGGGEQGEHQEQANLQVIANSWTLTKAQRTQGIEYFDLFDTFT